MTESSSLFWYSLFSSAAAVQTVIPVVSVKKNVAEQIYLIGGNSYV